MIKNTCLYKGLLILAALTAFILSSCGTDNTDVESLLSTVQSRDSLNCGVSTGLEGFSAQNTSGEWVGFDVDVCRAVAAAVLGDASKVNFVPLTAKERFTALSSGEIDVLSRNTTWTATRDTSLGLNFAGVNYYDGQGFMVKTKLGATKGTDLNGADICVQAGTTTELNASDFFRKNNLKYNLIGFDTSDQTLSGFESGRCDVLTSDVSQLASLRSKMANPSDAVILGEVISKEPLGPVVRQGDDAWFNVVKWAVYAFISAEEFGLTSSNVDSMISSTDDPNIKRFAGEESEIGEYLGLDPNWAYNIVSQVGNYGESYDRNIGLSSPLGLSRGVNAQWYDGGLIYAMPFR